MASIADRISRRVFGKPAVGRPAAALTRAVGLIKCSKYISRWCNWSPEEVVFELPCGNEIVRGKMLSAQGIDHVARQIWIAGVGSYEAPLPALFTALTRNTQNVLIIGANSGMYALLAVSGNGAKKVHAFEPYPPAIQWLEANIRLNKLESKIQVVKAAIGNTLGEADLYVPPPRFGATLETSASINPKFHEEVGQVVKVPVLTVDEYARQEKLERIDVMLIDVEGFEHSALEGSAETLKNQRPIVAFEVLTRSTTRVDLLEGIRLANNYRCMVMLPEELRFNEPIAPYGEHTNQLLVPAEGLERMRTAAGNAGLKVQAGG